MSGSRRDRDDGTLEKKAAKARPAAKPGAPPATRRAAAPRKATGGVRKPRAAGKGRGAGKMARFVPDLRRRWLRVALLVSAPLILLPIVHGFFGDFGAVLIGVLVLGFLVGRWTLPG